MKNKQIGITIAVVLLAAVTRADDRHEKREPHDEVLHNYIIERQTNYQVEGVPTSRMIIGKREFDTYSNGVTFEGNNVVGVRPPR